MSQFAAAAKNPPWVRTSATASQPPPAPGTSIATSILAAQATHAPTAGATAGQLAAAAVPAGTLATAAAVVAAAQTQQAQQTPVVSAPYGTGLAAITLTQSALQQGAVLQPQGIAIPASLAATTQVNSGMVVEIARLPQPGVALPTSLATTQVATVSYPAPRLLAQTAQFQAPQPHPHQAAVVQQAAAAAAAAAQAPQAPPQQTLKQRVFTGTVTKLHENFGFVDEDVFFQLSAVKGNLPKTGERVLVEAAYNHNMPFKWNATRIQVLPNQMCQVNVQPANNTRSTIAQVTPIVTTVMTAPVSVGLTLPAGVSMNTPITNIASAPAQFTSLSQPGRWQVQPEMTIVEPLAQQRVNIQYENRLEGSHPWISDYSELIENKVANARLPIMGRRHASPPPARREREREPRRDDRRERYRERERYSPPQRKRSRSPRRPSRSPPRRRPKLAAPRYNVQVPKISLDVREGNVMELRKRYSNLYIPSDFCSASFLWQNAFPPHHPFSLDHSCSFHILGKDAQLVSEIETPAEPSDTDYTYSAKVMLMASPGLKDIFKKSCALAEDNDESKENFVHPTRLISFLVGLKGKNETVAIGGPWSPSMDGPNPDKDPSVLIRTAIRTCKSLTSIDLSKCSQWYRFAEIHYLRGESTHKGRALPARVETVVLFLPDAWSCLPTRTEWDGLMEAYKKQLLKKLHEDQPVYRSTTQGEDRGDGEDKREPTHFSSLDPNSLYVSDLKRELEARNLSSKGLKSQLVARLTKAVKTECEKAYIGDQSSDDINGTNDDDDPIDEEEKKKEEEEEERKQREEKELVVMMKKLQMPENPSIVVHPSKTAKNGKFDCTIMSLSLLLDYRQEDNKEHSFEVSLFAELFNEMMMRDFGFRIYRSLVEAPEVKDDEKEKDKKKGDKKDEKYKKDDKDEYRKKDELDNDSDKDDDDSDDDNCDDDKKDRDRKRKKKKKAQMYTYDPYLLLSYIYFDQTHCGYLLDKDVEEILYTLGLHLSRAQTRKLLQKVYKREMFRYRKLTDRPITDNEKLNINSPKISLEELAAGNKKILPTFELPQTEETEDSEMKESNGGTSKNSLGMNLVTHQGAMVDVAKLLKQLDRSEKARIDTEQRLETMEVELDGLHELASSREKHSQKLSAKLEEQQNKLVGTEEELRRTLIHLEKYQRALSTTRDQLQAAMSIVDNTLRIKPMRSLSSRLNSNFLKTESLSSCLGLSVRESSFKARDKAHRSYDLDDLPKLKVEIDQDESSCEHDPKHDTQNSL